MIAPCLMDGAFRAYIQPRPEGTFDYGEPGDRTASVVVVRDLLGEPIDEVAWLANAEGRWFLRHGVASWLGQDFAWARMHHLSGEKALAIFQTPASWLRAGGRGACCLQWDARHFDDGILEPYAEVVCETPALQKRLRQTLWAACRPPYAISVAGSDRRAA